MLFKSLNTTVLYKYDRKYPRYISLPNNFWCNSTTNGEDNDKRIYISAGNRKERAS